MEKIALTPEQKAMRQQLGRQGQTTVISRTGEEAASEAASALAGQTQRAKNAFGGAARQTAAQAPSKFSGFMSRVGSGAKRFGKYGLIGGGLAAGAYGTHKAIQHFSKTSALDQIREDSFNDELDKIAEVNPMVKELRKHEYDYQDLKEKYAPEFTRRNVAAISGMVPLLALGLLAGKSPITKMLLGAGGGITGAGIGAGLATAYNRKKNPAFGKAFDENIDKTLALEEKALSEVDRLRSERKRISKQINQFRRYGM